MHKFIGYGEKDCYNANITIDLSANFYCRGLRSCANSNIIIRTGGLDIFAEGAFSFENSFIQATYTYTSSVPVYFEFHGLRRLFDESTS